MQAVSIQIPRQRTYVAGDRYSIYVNDGIGPVDYGVAPLAGDVPFWPGTRRYAGHLNESHLCWGHLDHAVQDGHLMGGHLEHGHLYPELIALFVTPLYYLGHYIVAVCADDAGGNRSGSPPATVSYTINSSPRPASDFSRTGYDEGADQVSFVFSSSPDLAA